MSASPKRRSKPRRSNWRRTAPRLEHPDTLVLIVDGNEDSRELYRLYLAHHGFRTETAADGDEALRKSRALKPAVILLDLTMPRLDGWAVAQALKTNPATRSIAIAALTGNVLAGARERARESGCDEFLPKPCLPEDALRVVRQLLTRQRAVRRSLRDAI